MIGRVRRDDYREPDEFTRLGCQWLAAQGGFGLILFGGTRGNLSRIALPLQAPDGALIWTRRSRPGWWPGGSILAVWVHPKDLAAFSSEIDRASNVLALEWAEGELDDWVAFAGAEEVTL